jgi:glycosyltransferase involved in cell wall biosynthesis
MKLSLGILAWNEENAIGAMIASLGTQTLFAAGWDVEILVLPNGCTDRTATVAREALETFRRAHPAVRVAVHEIAVPGKANAWNECVHRLSDPLSRYLIFLDADIRLLGDDTLLSLIRTLENDPAAEISTDRPVKHVEQKPAKSLRDRFLLLVGRMTAAAPGQLTGQLYAARAATLRQIVLPRGLIVDDGFLKQMVCTGGYAHPPRQEAIRRAPEAAHEFECYTRLADIFHHQVRQAVGQTIYSYLRDDLKACGRPVFAELRRRSEEDPDWLARLVREEVARRGWWVMDSTALSMRWRRIRFGRGPAQKAAFAALALAALAVDLPVFWAANEKLRRGKIAGIWKDTTNRVLT